MSILPEPYIPSASQPRPADVTDAQVLQWVSRIQPMQFAFSELFPRCAPQAWSELIAGPMIFTASALLPSMGSMQDRAAVALTEQCWEWAKRYHVDAQWVVDAAMATVVPAAMATIHQFPMPTKLMFNSQFKVTQMIPALDDDRYEGYVQITEEVTGTRVRQVLEVDCSFSAEPWSTGEESRQAFRDRIRRSFNERLDEAIDRAVGCNPVAVPPTPIEEARVRSVPATQAIEWLIQMHANDEGFDDIRRRLIESQRTDSEVLVYNKSTINRVVKETADLLRIPKPDYDQLYNDRRRSRSGVSSSRR